METSMFFDPMGLSPVAHWSVYVWNAAGLSGTIDVLAMLVAQSTFKDMELRFERGLLEHVLSLTMLSHGNSDAGDLECVPEDRIVTAWHQSCGTSGRAQVERRGEANVLRYEGVAGVFAAAGDVVKITSHKHPGQLPREPSLGISKQLPRQMWTGKEWTGLERT